MDKASKQILFTFSANRELEEKIVELAKEADWTVSKTCRRLVEEALKAREARAGMNNPLTNNVS